MSFPNYHCQGSSAFCQLLSKEQRCVHLQKKELSHHHLLQLHLSRITLGSLEVQVTSASRASQPSCPVERSAPGLDATPVQAHTGILWPFSPVWQVLYPTTWRSTMPSLCSGLVTLQSCQTIHPQTWRNAWLNPLGAFQDPPILLSAPRPPLTLSLCRSLGTLRSHWVLSLETSYNIWFWCANNFVVFWSAVL